MFRALLCSSSGGQIVLVQHLVSSLSLGDCSAHRLLESSRNVCTEQSPKEINPLAPELFLLILAHSVYKMWTMQEPNKLALWNKLHFEEKKTESIEHV